MCAWGKEIGDAGWTALFLLGERGVDEARPRESEARKEGRKEGDSSRSQTLFAVRKREIKRGLECETRWGGRDARAHRPINGRSDRIAC